MKSYKRNSNIIVEKLDDETLLIYLGETQNTHVLNATAIYIWENVEEHSSEEIAASLFSKVNQSQKITYDEIIKDTKQFIDELIEKHLIIQKEL